MSQAAVEQMMRGAEAPARQLQSGVRDQGASPASNPEADVPTSPPAAAMAPPPPAVPEASAPPAAAAPPPAVAQETTNLMVTAAPPQSAPGPGPASPRQVPHTLPSNVPAPSTTPGDIAALVLLVIGLGMAIATFIFAGK